MIIIKEEALFYFYTDIHSNRKHRKKLVTRVKRRRVTLVKRGSVRRPSISAAAKF
jgi:hypothetical protein